MSVDDVSASIGETGVIVDVSFQPGATDVAGYDFDITFDDTNLTATVPSNCSSDCGGLGSCSVAGNTISVTHAAGSALGACRLARITFDVSGTAPAQTYPLPVTPVGVSDPGGNDIIPDPTTYNDGSITVASGPSLDAVPASDTINITVNGSGNATSTFTANGGTVSTISCSSSGDSQISFSATPPASLADGASFDVTATCSAATTGTFNGSYSCTSDATNSPTTYDVTCNSGAGTASATVNPPSGGQLTIGPLVPGGSGSGQVVFTETNNQGVGYDVTGCAISGADAGSFSLNSTGTTVPAGGSSSITVNATAPADGSIVSATLDCTVNGSPYSITLGIFLQPLVVPTMTQWGLILMALGLFGFGFWTLRRRGDFTA